MRVVRLHVRHDQVELDDLRGVRRRGAWSLGDVRSQVDAVLASAPVIGAGALDARWATLERRVGTALREALPATLREALASSLAGHDGAWVAIEADDPAAGSLPWELLAGTDGASLEGSGTAAVARLLPGPRLSQVPRPRGGLRVLCPTPDDPVCAARVDALVPLASEDADVVALVCHGRRDGAAAWLDAGPDGLAGATVAHAWQEVLRGSAAVLLEVCEGAADLADALDGVVGSLLAAGMPAVVAPAQPISAHAAGTLTAGFVDAVRRGTGVAGAAVAGRRAVRRLARGDRASRWWLPRLLVSDVAMLDRHDEAALPQLPCPSPSAELDRWLRAACDVATVRGDAFVGVEHLVLALTEVGGPPHLVAMARRQRGPVERALDLVEPGTADLAWTRRVAGAGAEMRPGASVRDLWSALFGAGSAWSALDVPDGPDTISRSVATRGSDHPPRLFEVFGGPEDGRVVVPRPGEWFGRWDDPPKAEHTLYGDGHGSDRWLGRRHLGWLGDGRVEIVRPARVTHRGRVDEVPAGVHRFVAGALIDLTPGTRILLG